jgi:hypothetical protein
MSMWGRCQVQWYFRYVEGLKIPPSVSMAQGSAMHEGARFKLAARVEGAEEPSDSDTEEYIVNEFEEAGRKGLDLKEGDDLGKAKDELTACGKVLLEESLPDITTPTASEKRYDLNLEDRDVGLVAITDVEEEGRVRDFKLTSKTPDPLSELQPVVYTYCRWQETGEVPDFTYEVVKKLKTPKLERVNHRCTEADINFFFAQFDAAVFQMKHAIEAGNFVPNPCGWWCSESWCGYWNHCRGKGV